MANSAAIETADEPCVDGDAPLSSSVDVAWCVLEAAMTWATSPPSRRAASSMNPNGRLATWSDMKIIVDDLVTSGAHLRSTPRSFNLVRRKRQRAAISWRDQEATGAQSLDAINPLYRRRHFCNMS